MNLTKKTKNKIAIIIAIVISLYFSGYIFAIFSEPYKIAQNFIIENPGVNGQIGKVTAARLSFLGYSVHYSGPHGMAKFELNVSGANGQGKVFVDLEKRAGIWEITMANFKSEGGKIINLYRIKPSND